MIPNYSLIYQKLMLSYYVFTILLFNALLKRPTWTKRGGIDTIDHHPYFDGAVQSLEAVVDGHRMTVGIISPGDYDFGEAKEVESIMVVKGLLVINGETATVGQRVKIGVGQPIKIRASAAAAYSCVYL